jgi:hypothetical protein
VALRWACDNRGDEEVLHMSEEQISGPPEQSGDSGGWRPSFGRLPRTALAGGLAAGLALGGAGLAFAATSATSSSSPSNASPSTTVPAPGRPKLAFPGGPRAFGGLGGLGGLGAIGGLGGVVHGQLTVPNKSGGYQTVEIQTGKAGPVSSSSITVKSPDGYTHTYSVSPSTVVDAQRDGIASVASGDQVSVVATVVSGKDTATNIVDTTKVGASRNGFGFGPKPGRPGRPAAAPGPASFA